MKPDLQLRLMQAARSADPFIAAVSQDALDEIERLWDEQPAVDAHVKQLQGSN